MIEFGWYVDDPGFIDRLFMDVCILTDKYSKGGKYVFVKKINVWWSLPFTDLKTIFKIE